MLQTTLYDDISGNWNEDSVEDILTFVDCLGTNHAQFGLTRHLITESD